MDAHREQTGSNPAPDDPVAAAVGAFAEEIAALGSEDAKRLDREEELENEERAGRAT